MISNFARVFPFSLPAAFAAALVLVPAATPDVWNKRTEVKFTGAVEFPGGTVVPPGEYVLKLADSSVNRNIVQVLDENQNRVYATVLTFPAQRPEPAEKTIITFHETRGNGSLLIHRWFYPGDTVGREFPHSNDRRRRDIASAAYASRPEVPGLNETWEPETSTFDRREESRSEETLEAANRGIPSSSDPAPEDMPVAGPESGQGALPEPPKLSATAKAAQAPAAGENLPVTAGRTHYLAVAGGFFLGVGLLLKVVRRAKLSKRLDPAD